MKIHLAWIRVTAATATIAASATIGGQSARSQSQYAPYGAAPQYSSVAPYGVQPTQPPVYPTSAYSSPTGGAYNPAPQQAYTPAPARYAPTVQTPYVRPQYQPPQYQQPAVRPSYPSVARQTNGTAMPGESAPPSEALPTPDPAMNGMNGGAVSQGYEQGYNGGYQNGSKTHYL